MSLAQNITRAKGGDWSGNQGLIPGPGHSDSDRSLSVRDSDDGSDVVLHSFAGDDWRAIKDAFRAEGLLPPSTRRTAPAATPDAPDRVFTYMGADSAPAFRIVRKPGKRFIAETLGCDGWRAGMNGAKPIPYRLPELIGAHPDAAVFICEGEKDADAVAALGCVATCNPFGAGKWPANFAQYLEGREVLILPDNDAPGRAHADDVARKLAGIAQSVAIVPLPGLADKGDVSDWLAAGGTMHQLLALAARSIDEADPARTADAQNMLALIDPATWANTIAPAREWALEGWLPARQASLLAGDGGTGKSLLAQQLATCTALGLPFLGVATRQAAAIYITCEDDADELHRRQQDICAALGVPMNDLAGKLHLVSLFGHIGNELATFDGAGRLATTDRWAELRATVRQTGAGFVALDNVAHLFAGNEIVRSHVAGFCSLLNSLALEAAASVLLLGHPSKAKDSEYSGSTAWENQFRARLFLETPTDKDGTIPDPDARILKRSKSNYARTGETIAFRWHKWAFVRDDDLPADHRAEIAANVLAAAENAAFLKCLSIATEQKRAVSHVRGTNWAGNVFFAMPEGKSVKPQGYARALERLLSTGKIKIDQPLWRGANRVQKQGIKLASDCTDPPAPTPCTDLHKPPAQVSDIAAPTLHASTPLILKYKSGAALGAGAPDIEVGSMADG